MVEGGQRGPEDAPEEGLTERTTGSTAPTPPAVRPVSRRRIILIVAGVFAALIATILVQQLATWPDVQALTTSNPESTAFIDRYREQLREQGHEDAVRWRWVPYDRISQQLKAAVVVSEDIEFFNHTGFSTSEIRAAIREAIEEGDLRGASTITQQLAKNLWLSPSRNPFRKLKEALLTHQLEKHLTKERILEIYLNVVELGTGIYGAEAAARHYFGKPASDLTRNEAVRLAAALPRPSVWHPGSERSGFYNRVAIIDERMNQYPDFLARHFGAGVVFTPPPVPSESLDTLDIVVPDSLLGDTALLDTIVRDTVATDTLRP